jgi:hypothetical protein
MLLKDLYDIDLVCIINYWFRKSNISLNLQLLDEFRTVCNTKHESYSLKAFVELMVMG